MSVSVSRICWPKRPYKGLQQYEYDDAPLFAGRKEEIQACAKELLRSEISLFLLHGQSGCGKSSFLRAGLIPHLNERRLRSNSGQPSHRAGSRLWPISLNDSFVIRSGRKPLMALARATYVLIDQLDRSEAGSRDKLRAARLRCQSLEEFIAKTGVSELRLFESLAHISLAVSGKLLLIIDQAEDIFTSEIQEEQTDRHRYFRLLSTFSLQPIDMKVLISLRNEFEVRFGDALREAHIDFARVIGRYF